MRDLFTKKFRDILSFIAKWRLLLQILCSVLALITLVSAFDNVSGNIIIEADQFLICLILGAVVFSLVFTLDALRFKYVLSVFGYEVSFSKTLKMNLNILLPQIITPGGVGADVARAAEIVDLQKDEKVVSKSIMGVIIYTRILGVVSLLALCVLSISTPILTIILLALSPLLIRTLTSLNLNLREHMVKLILISFLIHLITSAFLKSVLMLTTGVTSFNDVTLMPLILLAQIVPVTFLGFGVREFLGLYYLTGYYEPDKILASTLLFGLVYFIFCLLVGGSTILLSLLRTNSQDTAA